VWIGDDEAATVYFDAGGRVILKEWVTYRQPHLHKLLERFGV
jgi:hypothetical protein